MKKFTIVTMLTLIACIAGLWSGYPSLASDCKSSMARLSVPAGDILEDTQLCPNCLLTADKNYDLSDLHAADVTANFMADHFRAPNNYQYIYCGRCGKITRPCNLGVLTTTRKELLAKNMIDAIQLSAQLISGGPSDTLSVLHESSLGVNVCDLTFSQGTDILFIRYEKGIRLATGSYEVPVKDMSEVPGVTPSWIQSAATKLESHGFKLRSYAALDGKSKSRYWLFLEKNCSDPDYAYAEFAWSVEKP